MTDKIDLLHQRLNEIEKAELLMVINTHLSPAHGYQLRRAYAETDRHKATLTAMTKWLEENQPDVFRRGLWDAIQP